MVVDHKGACCDCVEALEHELTMAGSDADALARRADEAENTAIVLEAEIAALRRRAPTPTYAEVMAACAAGARRLGVNPAPWEAQV